MFITFIIALILPTVLSVAVIFGIANYQSKILEKTYGIENMSFKSLMSSEQLIREINAKNFSDLRKKITGNPESLEDERFMEEQNEKLLTQFSYLMVRKNGVVIFDGWKSGSRISSHLLPAFGSSTSIDGSGLIIEGDPMSILRQFDMKMADNDKYSVFVITQSTDIPQLTDMIKSMVCAIMLVLFVTMLLAFSWVYQDLIHPLNRLTKATQNIMEGNLDFTMQGIDSKDEIGILCSNFEKMRKQLADQAEEKLVYDKESKELISNISHDLKTPITAVKGYVEGIMDGVADTPEKMDRYIKTIYNKANEMDALINELTFYSKIDTNRIPYTFDRINTVGFFGDCAEELELDLTAKGIAFDYANTVDDQVRIIADAEQLRRVINNIVGNSIKYMREEPGHISIRVRDVGDYVQVEIEDNGRGIAAKDLPLIFDRFYRSDSSRNSSKGGSGIGLSIVKKIIDDHGGKIWASSVEGKGTTMTFVIRKYQEVPV